MALVVAAPPGPGIETAEDREGLRRQLEAEFASPRFGLLARNWAYASLPCGLGVWFVVSGWIGRGWAFPAVLLWGFAAGLSLAFALLQRSALRRSSSLPASRDRMLVGRRTRSERRLEAALLQLTVLTGALLAVVAFWPSLLPAPVTTTAALVWGWSSVGAVLFLAVTALTDAGLAESRLPLR